MSEPVAADPARPARQHLLDSLRGGAIVAMILYHLLWDLTLYGFVPVEIILSPALKAIQVLILGSFLAIAGASFELATRGGVRWAGFWRRLGLIVAAALAITVVTVLVFPETYVFFGVLHALALFTLIGLLARRLPAWALLLVGAVIVAAPLLWTDPVFIDRRLAWIGFYPDSPPTNDLVPIFPWLGVFLAGMGAMRLVASLPSTGPGLLALAGRWSLVIYLVHQPLLFGIIYPLSLLRPAEAQVIGTRETEFVRSCEAACTGGLDYCQRYCGCALNAVSENDLWQALAEPDPGGAVGEVQITCAALAEEL